MKRYIFFAVMSSVLLMTGCIDRGTADYVPSISTSFFVTTTGDTLERHYNATDNFYYLDSVSVGDTVFFNIGFYTYANFLVTTDVDWDTTMLAVSTSLTPDFRAGLSNASDSAAVDALHYEYTSGYNGASFPLFAAPKQSGSSKMSFVVESNAQKVQNTTTASVWFYVR